MNEPKELGNREEADSVQRALAAIGRQAEQQEPSEQVLADALAQMRRAGSARTGLTKNILLRITTMTFTQKIAAAVMLTVGGLVLWFAMTMFGGFSSISYADVAEQIRAAHTMSWTETVSGGPIPQPMTMKTQCLEPGHVRMEMPTGQGQDMSVIITDQATGKSLVLNEAAKTAQFIEVKTTGTPQPMQDTAAFFRNLAEQHGEPIEPRQIGDIKARGFRVTSFGYPASIWVDPATKLPLLVECTMTMNNQPMKVDMTDFVFDAPLDASLFSMDAPAGYKVQTMRPMVVTADIEQNVTTLLKFYSAHSNGAFPPSLTDITDLAKLAAGNMKDGKFDDETQNAMSAIGALFATVSSMKSGTDYGYTPDGVKLGDADKLVFWYRKKDTQNYRAIYGDLHAADIAEADLPVGK
jgi:outer membrane lipoprotein-sorting protein